jgi:hypothetical protein
MKKSASLTFLLLGLTFAGCDQQPTGLLQQRVAELEAQNEAMRKRADLLQSKLDAKEVATPTPASPAAPATTETKSEDDSHAMIGAAVTPLVDSLREKLKPGSVQAYSEAAWAGIRLEKSGESRGVAVPFFKDGSGQWICGWSEAQVLEALNGQVAATPAVVETSIPVTPQPAPPPPVVENTTPPIVNNTVAMPTPPTPPTPPQPETPKAGNLVPKGGNKAFFVDPATGKLYRIKPDGTREPVPELR